MFEITHQEARALLHAATDQKIDPGDKTVLNSHLSGCRSCSDYANSLENLEVNLRKVMHAKWDVQKPNLNVRVVIHPNPARIFWNNFMGQTHAMEKLSIVVVLVLGYILIANIVGIQSPVTREETPTPLPTPNELPVFISNSPTPSAVIPLTETVSENCETAIYVVLANDTLESIALRHGTTEETIQEINNLTSNTVYTGMELAIPVCNATPSHTATTTKNTLTITPLSGTLFPTQPE